MSSTQPALSRRDFLRRGSQFAVGAVAVGALTSCASQPQVAVAGGGKVFGANDQITMAFIGINGRGSGLIDGFSNIKGVRIKTLCDCDEKILGRRADEMEKKTGKRPVTEFDMRKVFEDKEIDAVAIAMPNHWHALGTIWACQAGKHVYVEKPCSHNIFEGRKMIEAARKYNRFVEVGFQNRSIKNVRSAMEFLRSGKLGRIYMGRGLCFKPRDGFKKFPDSQPPKELHWDMWVGPAQMYPYNEGKCHYNWHWHWNTGNGDTGNQGPHQFDVARWGINKDEHPVRISSFGGYYKFEKECTQETPNTQTSLFEYADGTILEFGTRGLYTNGEPDVKIGNLFYGTEGWMQIDGGNWKTFMGRKNEPGITSKTVEASADPMNLAGAGADNHFENFVESLRANKQEMLTCDIEVGYMSTCLPHLANISYRLKRQLTFNGKAEKFVGDSEADKMLTRKYRAPYIVPDKV